MTDSALCQVCRKLPFVQTVSDGHREIPVCLACLRTLADDALRLQRNRQGRSERVVWRAVLREV